MFSPWSLRNVLVRNRTGLAPMSTYSAVDTRPTEWHRAHYAARSRTPGIAIVEATAVSQAAAITPQDLAIDNDAAVPAFARLVEAILNEGAVPGIQLSHGGPKSCRTRPWEGDRPIPHAAGGWPIIGPTDLPFADGFAHPQALDERQIREVISEFGSSANRSARAGFKFLELHAGHGRLLHSFLSPVSNHRTDDYGGTWENRIRLLMEVVIAVRQNWPADYPLAVRLSCTDWTDTGWTIDDSVRLSAELAGVGVDLIDCTSGGITRGIKVNTFPGYQVEFAREIRRKAGIATAAVGLINDVKLAREIIDTESADMVLFGRKMLLEPYFLATDQDLRKVLPLPYERGARSLRALSSIHVPEL